MKASEMFSTSIVCPKCGKALDMTVEMMINELKKCDPKARVVMHGWDCEEVLFVLSAFNNHPTSNVWLEGLNDIDVEEELKAELEHASEIANSEADFYAYWLEMGITPDIVYEYLGKEAADHMEMVCEEHGLI